jgi:hypothetical protein
MADLMTALRNADAAGDTEAAQRIAAMIRTQQSAQPSISSNPTEGNSFLQNLAAGLGQGMTSAGDKAGQFLAHHPGISLAMGQPPLPGELAPLIDKEVKDKQALDAPLLQTGGGKVGSGAIDAVETAAEFMPGAKVAGMLGKGGGLIKNALLQSMAAGSTEAGKGLENGNVDPSAVGTAALMGGGSELASPIIGAAGRAVKNYLTSDAQALAVGKKLAADAGFNDLPHDALIKLGRSASQVEAGADPKALAAQAQYGLELTKGQRMAGAGKFDQLAQEEALRNSANNPAGEMIRQADTNNAQSVRGAFDHTVAGVSGGSTPSSVPAAMENVADSVRAQAGALKSKVNTAYEAANTKDAWVSGQPLADLQARTVGAVNLVDDKLTPATVSVLRDIGDTSRTGALTLDQLDTLRKRIAASAGAAANPTDKANVVKVKNELDSWLDDSMDKALISGDQTALGQLKQARALRAEYGSRFQVNDPADKGAKLVALMVKDGKSPEELAQLALGTQQVSPAAAVSVSRSVRNALGDDAAAFDQYRGALLMKLGQGKNGDAVGLQQLSSNIKTMLTQRPTLIKENYSPEEASQLGQVANALDVVLQKSNVKQSSGTAERAMQFLTSKASTIPLVGSIFRMAAYPAQVMQGARLYAPLVNNPQGLGALGGAAADYSSQ